ncbi:hypothetical protein ACLOJK_033362 [Asimina triloba]
MVTIIEKETTTAIEEETTTGMLLFLGCDLRVLGLEMSKSKARTEEGSISRGRRARAEGLSEG